MTEEDKRQLAFALSVISGRRNLEFLNSEQIAWLGFDYYRYNVDDIGESYIKARAEEIIVEMIAQRCGDCT